MKHTLILSLAFSLMSLTALAQLTLTVEIDGLRNNTGRVFFELSNENNERVVGITRQISNNKSLIVIENLKPGRYAFRFFHDENNNEKLDTNRLGIPREGFGFSNNPSMTFGPPSFDKTLFELKESTIMKCKPKYY